MLDDTIFVLDSVPFVFNFDYKLLLTMCLKILEDILSEG